MVPPKKRSKESETQNSAVDESLKLRKRFRALVSPVTAPKVDTLLVETFVKMLQSSLFMHQGRLLEVRSVIEEIDAENERVTGVFRLLEILRSTPPVHSFLSDMLLLFLKPEEALELNCFEAYRSRMQSLEILLKAQQCQRIAKSRALSKGPLRSLHASDALDTVDPNAIYESLISWFGADARFSDFISPLFADRPVDARLEQCEHGQTTGKSREHGEEEQFQDQLSLSNVSMNDFETIHSDFLHEHEADEFEVINWTDVFENEPPSYRQCSCSCHQDNATTNGPPNSHCGLCSVKFFGECAYIWRGSRLVRAQIELSDYEELSSEAAGSMPSTVSPTKIFSSSIDVVENSAEWGSVFQAVDYIDNGDDAIEFSPVRKPTTPRSSSTTPRKSAPGYELSQDVLKQAFMETFGRNLWGKGYSPLKRPGPSFGIGGPNEESNSTSCVFVRGFDGANTMLATMACDSNSAAAPSYSAVCFDPLATSNSLHGARTTTRTSSMPAREETPSEAPAESETTPEEDTGPEDTWTEDDDRYLLEQFKLHGNVYEAATAAMTKLRKSRHAARDRLKLLLDLLKQAM